MIYCHKIILPVGCDSFLRRTHAPCTSRSRFACTRARTPILWWSHFAPAPQALITYSSFAKRAFLLGHCFYRFKINFESIFYFPSISQVNQAKALEIGRCFEKSLNMASTFLRQRLATKSKAVTCH